MFKFKYILIVMPLLLSACQITPKDVTSIQQQWQIHQEDLKQINTFQVNGSIAYFSDKSRNYGRFLIIQQSVDRYGIKLTTPLGGNIFTLKVDTNYAELIDRNGYRYIDNNVENLIRKISNINIPLNSLHDWLKGYSNDIANDKLDNAGRLISTSFMQDSKKWNVKIANYIAYSLKNRNIDMPATIELTHDDERIRLKIDKWILK
ncbi:outer membrane lipoprotein LolB [Gilliamella sp. Choc4-2]|uniref:lipoprotein insertase outer membrane protein LolB n=1 Tax=unclassified Gilliamella TaxID=2685620 RepID=UPI000555384F|nr:lipoprotein insertase outer membrane protein LolB [Gilliamella apicola]OCG31323.1 outer membrane lipoprotein LolB [Gilliamella apicola]OCG47408.1 outer membrane lipoprotein LolB [Gilliamella apicola]OCG55005.1 outer membrane lipoprotein LolB [Gilliamella apicola]OCG62593.1 outer membrane lipoprotein LolB [Gilliamella apicola]